MTAYAKGSSITAARQVLAERLAAARDSHPGRPRLVYYLGDGEQTSGKEPAAMAFDAGLVAGGAVLGYGTPEGGRMKENTGLDSGDGTGGGAGAGRSDGYVRDSGGQDALSVIDEGRLRTIAAQLGVPYVHRDAGASVADMMQQAHPGRAAHSDSDSSVTAPTELYWLFAAGAFLLALPEAVAVLRRLRGLPRTVRTEDAR